MRSRYRLMLKSNRLVDGVGCPCDRVLNSGYGYCIPQTTRGWGCTVRWWYQLTFTESNRLVDGVGCPCNRVINSGYRYCIPQCVILSVTCPTILSAILSSRHVTATHIRSLPCFPVIVSTIVVALTLSAVHQWVGYFRVAQRARLPDWGICCPHPLLLFIVLQ